MGPITSEEVRGIVMLIVLVASIGFIVWAVWYEIVVGIPESDRRAAFVTHCIIENKALPAPETYCDALWRQGGGR